MLTTDIRQSGDHFSLPNFRLADKIFDRVVEIRQEVQRAGLDGTIALLWAFIDNEDYLYREDVIARASGLCLNSSSVSTLERVLDLCTGDDPWRHLWNNAGGYYRPLSNRVLN